jgi:hypothetical protein
MSIFELPTAVQPPVDEPMLEEQAPSHGFNPRSVQIAAAITAALVALGLVVSNAAKPDTGLRPALTSKAGPGAAAIEQVERAPAPVEASVGPTDTQDDEAVSDAPAAPDSDTAPVWQEPSSDTAQTDTSDGSKWDGHAGKGHGHWR